MGWWSPFGGASSGSGGSSSSSSSAAAISSPSEHDAWVPPPPAGVTLAPPTPPRHLATDAAAAAAGRSGAPTGAAAAAAPFKGFSPPPPATTGPGGTTAASSSSSSSPFSTFFPSFSGEAKSDEAYEKEDFSQFTGAGAAGSEGRYFDRSYPEGRQSRHDYHDRGADVAPGLLDRFVTNPRLRACLEGVKMGMKMGAAVGGIFGVLTGSYAAVVNRNFWILPMSALGGAVSFSFFLGCGMVVRCDDKGDLRLCCSRAAAVPPSRLLSPHTSSSFASPSPACWPLLLPPAAGGFSRPPVAAAASSPAYRRTPFGLAAASLRPSSSATSSFSFATAAPAIVTKRH